MKKALLVLGILIFLSSIGLASTTYTVTNCADSSLTVGSLRWALWNACQTSNPADIIFDITTKEAGYSTGEAYSGLVTNEGTSKKWFRIVVNSLLPAFQNYTLNIAVRGSTQTR